MAQNQIQSVSHTHEAMMDWMLQNPQLGLREMSAFFGYSMAWLSVVINSDAFAHKFAERRTDLSVRVNSTLTERMQAVAEIGLEKLANVLEKTEDPKVIVDATDKILHRMGYAPQSAKSAGAGDTNIQQNIFVASKSDLAEARKLIGAPVEVEVLTAEVVDVSSTDAAGV